MLIVQNAAAPGAIRNALVDLIALTPADVKIASAYVTLGGTTLILDALQKAVGTLAFNLLPKLLVTSFDFGITEPQALGYWSALPNTIVKVSGADKVLAGSLMPARAFHPKLYSFRYDTKSCGLLVGSANLTNRGFSVNTEAAWVEGKIPVAAREHAFHVAQFATVPLTKTLLEAYKTLRAKKPPPPEIVIETLPVPPPPLPAVGSLRSFRDAIEQGDVDPTNFTSMWVHGEGLQGGSGNQLELPRGAHIFFGFHFTNYAHPKKITIGTPILRSGSAAWTDRLLTWHGDNQMERMNLPTASQGGFNYADSAVMFRRLADGSFELIVTPWDSDVGRSWRQASAQNDTLFRLGRAATNRLVGFI